jgi:hypothetical protein
VLNRRDEINLNDNILSEFRPTSISGHADIDIRFVLFRLNFRVSVYLRQVHHPVMSDSLNWRSVVPGLSTI